MIVTVTRSVAASILGLIALAATPARAAPEGPPPDPRAALDPLARRLVEGHYCGGLVVALIPAAGPPQILAWGETVRGNGQLPDGNTVFEIGSVTKVFTSLLLAEMAIDKQVQLDTPVSALLPHARLPAGKRAITLLDLATHTAGLPRMPDNLHHVEGDSAYAAYTVDRLFEFLASATLASEPGARYQYSNVGGALLGLALAKRARADWPALVAAQITRPLAMTSTMVALDASARARFAQGYDADGEPAMPLDIPAFVAAGALHSTALDMTRFVQAEIAAADKPASRLARAMALTQTAQRNLDDNPRHGALGLAWLIRSEGTLWHNGQTEGHHSLIAFVPSQRVGVVVLASGAAAMIDFVGAAALSVLQGAPMPPGLELPPPDVAVDDKTLDTYTGSYELGAGLTINVSHRDGKLYAQAPDLPQIQLHPTSPTEFWAHMVPARLTFELDAKRNPTGLVLHLGGKDQRARRR